MFFHYNLYRPGVQGTGNSTCGDKERRKEKRSKMLFDQHTPEHIATHSSQLAAHSIPESRIVSHHVKYFDRCRNLETELPLRRTFRACTVYSGLNQSSSLWRVERYKYHFDSLFCQGMIVLKSKTTATSQGYAPDV